MLLDQKLRATAEHFIAFLEYCFSVSITCGFVIKFPSCSFQCLFFLVVEDLLISDDLHYIMMAKLFFFIMLLLVKR